MPCQQAVRHSGAERSEEPGIHNPGAGTMDSGLTLRVIRNDDQRGTTPSRPTLMRLMS